MTTQTPDYHLIGLYTRYSSWTARVEAVLEYFKIPHTHQFIQFSEVYQSHPAAYTKPQPNIPNHIYYTHPPENQIKAHSPTGLVPILRVNTLNTTISDSLAICEFLAESHPELAIWPRDRKLRALARTAASQMHSGFAVLRNTFHTNFLARYTGNVPIPENAMAEIERMFGIWDAARLVTKERLSELGEKDGGFLFGGFSVADAFFWPVLWRFRSYGVPLDAAGPDALAWMEKMWNDPVFRALGDRYYGQAKDPESRIAHYDDIFRGREDIQYSIFPQDWTFSVTGK